MGQGDELGEKKGKLTASATQTNLLCALVWELNTTGGTDQGG